MTPAGVRAAMKSAWLAIVTVASCHSEAPRAPDPTTVVTDLGAVRGVQRGALRTFFGIPFAAPPIGARRWLPPDPAAPWTGVRDGSQHGAACIQADDQRPVQSEDCLFLDVWAPPAAREPRPVLLWIHGGSFYTGSGSDDLYDGAALAARTGAIVVTINYRLGPLGFLSHRAIAAELGRAHAPAVGLLDQRAAMAWVQRNAAAFGGDPARITIFGESAGAWSVCAQLASPASRGLFAGAIMQSGACDDALYFDPPAAEAQGDALAAALGCTAPDPLPCLRAQPAAAVVHALPMKRGSILQPGASWGPVIDGTELPAHPLAAMRAGTSTPVPLLLGANRDEGTAHVRGFDEVTTADLVDFVGTSFGSAAVEPVLARYRRPDPRDALDAIITDGVFVCGARRVARTLAARDVPVFLYAFNHPLADARVHDLGATHTIELFFMFGNVSLGFGITDDERPLSWTMMDAWGAFARTGDPTTAGLAWPRYDPVGDRHAMLDLPSTIGAGLKSDACDFWDRLVTD